MSGKAASMSTEDASMSAKDASMSAKAASMSAKAASMSAKVPSMSGKAASMIAKAASLSFKASHSLLSYFVWQSGACEKNVVFESLVCPGRQLMNSSDVLFCLGAMYPAMYPLGRANKFESNGFFR